MLAILLISVEKDGAFSHAQQLRQIAKFCLTMLSFVGDLALTRAYSMSIMRTSFDAVAVLLVFKPSGYSAVW
ncbi:hypothetical protein BST96_18905 [Oceanicoccus sagamiensis]|uniref:Uncharacterized protein n=1 Tax=Oceanicoccus sagamiensis TaxID=716816 RepID=A0A1X9NHW0_9GAMM|nr:hypothetical protein BST96_18905 [Oceanicoccus sagamiensis]